MKLFNEATLEEAIMSLMNEKGFTHYTGTDISKKENEFILYNDLRKYLISRYNISMNETSLIINEIRALEKYPVYEANKKFMNMLINGFDFKRENPQDKDIHISLLDFNNIENNNCKIVNQVEYNENHLRIPDGVIYVNGLPIVIFEFKSAVNENTTIYNAYEQLTIRYMRDIPTIFRYNAFCVISDGVNNKVGTVFSKYEFFYYWKDENENNVLSSLDSMVNVLFNKKNFFNVIHNFIYFPDKSDKKEKIISRYPQYFAATKLLDNIKQNKKPYGNGKGGVYFGATGCGKSYTMLYLTRLLMKDIDLKNPTIIIITDRTDLDDQLSKIFCNSTEFIGDNNVVKVLSRNELKQNLGSCASGGVYLTTIQKFSEDIDILSERENIICISDEAHRSQVNLDKNYKIKDNEIIIKYGFAKYLHDSLPNATYVGFTGTPIDATMDVFGNIVDSYTMKQSVNDGITVNITYDGRSAKVFADNEKLKEIETYYEQCALEGANEYQIEASKKASIRMDLIIGDPSRLEKVANDIIEHYEKRVYENATVNGKAMIVCSNRNIAFDLYKIIVRLRPDWAIEKTSLNEELLSEKDKQELFPIPMINLVMTENSNDSEELTNLLKNKSYRKKLDRLFKNENSNFKIAIVVDMWLTGFDVPSLDTMYIDKPLQDHTLIQTISRVNRKYPGKDKGVIVDYIGIKNRMQLALKKFNNDESEVFEGIDDSIKIFRNQLALLDSQFRNFDNEKFFVGNPNEKLACLNRAVEYVQLDDESEKKFMHSVQVLKSSFNICISSGELTELEKDKTYFYGAIRSIIFKLTKGEAPDVDQMNIKVRELIKNALISDGVEELFDSDKEIKTREIDIFNKEYLDKINKLKMPNTKIKLLQRLLKVAIDEYKQVNKIKGLEFMEKFQKLIDEYNNRVSDENNTSNLLDDISKDMTNLINEIEEDKNSYHEIGIDFEEKAFFDILNSICEKNNIEFNETKKIELAKEIKRIVTDKSKYTDWSKKENIKAELQQDIIILLDEYDFPTLTTIDVYEEVLEQAENFKKYYNV